MWFLHRYSHGVSSPGRHVRTRLYFTSESHVHSLLTVLRYGGLLDVSNIAEKKFILYFFFLIFDISIYRWWKTNSGDARWNMSAWSPSWTICLKLSLCCTKIRPRIRVAKNVSTLSCILVLALIVAYRRICRLAPDSDHIRATKAVII